MIDIGADMRNLVQPESLQEDIEVETKKSEKKVEKPEVNHFPKHVTKRPRKYKQPPRNRRGARV